MNDEQYSCVHHSSFIIHRLFPIRAIFPPLLAADTGFPLCYGPAPFLDRPPCKEEIPMSLIYSLTMNWLTVNILGFVLGYWFSDSFSVSPPPAAQATAAENCLTTPVSCCFKDVSLQEACEWFEYLMCVKINIDEDAMRQA